MASSFWMWIFLWIKEGKEPDSSKDGNKLDLSSPDLSPLEKKPYKVMYSMSPKTEQEFQEMVRSYRNIILGIGVPDTSQNYKYIL